MKYIQGVAQVSCHIGLFEGEPVATFIGKSAFYAPEHANYFVHENALFPGCLFSHTLCNIFYERRMIWFLTMKSLMNVRSLDKSGWKSPFRGEKTLTQQVKRFARFLPKTLQCDITCQNNYGFLFGFFITFFCKKGISWVMALSLRSLQHSRDLDGIKCFVARFIRNHERKIIHHPLISTLT